MAAILTNRTGADKRGAAGPPPLQAAAKKLHAFHTLIGFDPYNTAPFDPDPV